MLNVQKKTNPNLTLTVKLKSESQVVPYEQ